jgi:NhaP-type Na+/H+ or K+/H+ antiporter
VPSFIYLFNLGWYSSSIMLAFLFAILCYGTDPMMCVPEVKRKNRVLEIMEIESLINPPITSVIAFIILAALGPSSSPSVTGPAIFTFFSSILIAIISGLVVSYVVLSILKKNYFGELTHLAVITSAIITYVGAELFGGIGALSVAVYGIFFGNSHISHLIEIERFESILSNSVKILTFMLVGTVILILPEFIIKGTILFLLCLLVRFISVLIMARKERFKLRHIIFMTLNVPKNIEVAVILLIIITLYSDIRNISAVINSTMLMILYSIALASVSSQFYGNFFNHQDVKKIKRH